MATTNPPDLRDQILQDAAPAVMVPNFSEPPPMAGHGHRYLVARDGVYLEISRAACHLRLSLGPVATPLPFGAIAEETVFHFGRLSQHLPLFHRFLADARNNLPNEFAAWLVWDEFDCELRYRACKTIEASAGRVHFERPRLDKNESLAVDLHSHGVGHAFFSANDDEDDAGEVKISGVVGEIDRATPSSVFRLCAMGVVREMVFPAEAWK